MPTKKQLVVAGVSGVVVAGAAFVAYRALSRKKEDGDDGAFSQPTSSSSLSKPQQAQQNNNNSSSKHASAAKEPQGDDLAAAASGDSMKREFTRDYSFSATKENEALAAAVPNSGKKGGGAAAAAPHATSPPQKPHDDSSVPFDHLGVRIVPLPGWTVEEAPSPMPNVAMITITRPEFAERMQQEEGIGTVPVIILSVEDISSENLTLEEFSEKSKQLAVSQMMMMTQGMYRPNIEFDGALRVGPFSHCLEYAQQMPPYFDLKVMNLITVKNGLAYVFQIMCSPKVMQQYKPQYTEMARSIEIATDSALERTDFTKHAFVSVSTGALTIRLHPTWSWAKGLGESLLDVTTASVSKTERLSVYRVASVPKSSATVKKSEKDVDGVAVQTLTEGSKEKKLFTLGDVAILVTPQQKSKSSVSEEEVIAALKSIKLDSNSSAANATATFVSKDHGYSFQVQHGSKLIASRVGGGTVVYAPNGLPSDPMAGGEEQQGPTVTIRCGTPDTDPDCTATLKEWEERIRSEAAGGSISNIAKATINGRECLTFVNKDMQEVGPNQRVEVQGKVFIFLNDGMTTMIRWETPTGMWRKNERKMEQMIATVDFE